MAIIQIYVTTSDRLPELQIKDGQLIFVKDTQRIYLDFNSLRTEYSAIHVLPTEEDRQALSEPSESFYYVEDSAALWRFKQKWIRVTPVNLDPVYIGDFESFPSLGVDDTLYVGKDATYAWDNETKTYMIVSNRTEWDSMINE